MKITLLCMGKTKESFIREGMDKYERYIRHYIGLEIRELKEEKINDLREAPLVRKKEAEKIIKALPPAARVLALDERGREYTSHEFAGMLNKQLETGVKELVFVIGGALGLDETIIRDAHGGLAISRWTMTHEMARLALLEQLYRAFTIITGKTYHY
jgi:23S rRNA (pseudouridine1915-N3)-methyltransferase